ncbi:Hypothetical protein NTJ_13148 [Nesidiocoris tenuis]|uniref:Uncharacterized protein n=1 Tax=Nesidiocoris tenuis TaxID=355587 RepID=A0ABN7B7I6_9HEMI|nr:Hypothetical protein NTJ_13148 [Nesidiocoris tenuis]
MISKCCQQTRIFLSGVNEGDASAASRPDVTGLARKVSLHIPHPAAHLSCSQPPHLADRDLTPKPTTLSCSASRSRSLLPATSEQPKYSSFSTRFQICARFRQLGNNRIPSRPNLGRIIWENPIRITQKASQGKLSKTLRFD